MSKFDSKFSELKKVFRRRIFISKITFLFRAANESIRTEVN